MNLMQALHTIRHLKARQITGQIALRARRMWEDPRRVMDLEVPPFPGILWKLRKPMLPPPQNQTPGNLTSGRMEFLHQSVDMGFPPAWNRTDLSRLWLYNVQYFEYLWALDYPAAARIVADWIDRHTPAKNRVGWEPYPTSLRLMNWAGVFFDKFRERIESDPELREKIWQSMFRQARWLESHLETHLMGNHLLENAAALTLVGSCFAGDAAAGRYRLGLELLREQLAEQILPDGGHFERSPMYHCRVVYVLSLLDNLNREELSERIRPLLRCAVGAMKHMCHPDGEIALLNDSALGIYNSPVQLAEYAGDGGAAANGAFALPQTGYFGWRGADGDYLICDAGAIGPDYQPGHAHGDMLSFELSLGGQRVIVDSGVSGYVPGAMRDYCRSTWAHNTIEIDSQDQCEFWGAFRVARRGTVSEVKWTLRGDGFEMSAAHDGYARLAGRPIHRRKFRWDNRGRLEVWDTVESTASHRIVSRLHLHPDCRVELAAAAEAQVQYSGGELRIAFVGIGQLKIEKSRYCPEFGQCVANAALAFAAEEPGSQEIGLVIERR